VNIVFLGVKNKIPCIFKNNRRNEKNIIFNEKTVISTKLFPYFVVIQKQITRILKNFTKSLY